MYPILYRRKTRTGFLAGLLLLALLLRVLWEPGLRAALWEKARAVLGSEALFRGIVFLETGLLPPVGGAEPGAEELTAAPAATGDPAPTETLPPAETTAEAAEAAAVPELPAFTPEEAEAIGLRGNCSYEVDKAALLLRPLNWPDEPGPKVLIIHSHSCESYTPSEGHEYQSSGNYRTLDLSNSVVAVGDALAERLSELGVEVLHDRTYNDYPDYNRSYANAREKTQTWLAQYPSVVLVIDLHRDALDEPVRETVERDGKLLAPMMLAVGTDQGGLEHPHWEDNLSCGLKLQALGQRDEPCLFKRLSFRKERFNGDLCPGALIVEVGSTENTLEEAVGSMEYLAEYVSELLRCP